MINLVEYTYKVFWYIAWRIGYMYKPGRDQDTIFASLKFWMPGSDQGSSFYLC